MKNNLEKAFKEKLDQYEAPYDASAWDAMNKRLDARQSGGNNLLKWISGSAALIAIVAVSTYYLTKDDTTKTTDDRQLTEQKVEQTSNADIADQTNNGSTDPKEVVQEDKTTEESTTLSEEKLDPDNSTEAPSLETFDESNDESVEDASVSTKTTGENETPTHVQSNESKAHPQPENNFITGSLINNKVCTGESIFIRNTGAKNALMKIKLDDQVVTLKKAQIHEFTPKESGTILYLDGKNNVIGQDKFTVFEKPTPDFSMKANLFENGLPITRCETYGDYESVVWTFGKDEIKSEGRKATHHFYKKGDHDIILTVQDFNGCENSVKKTVRIEDDYNLMAVDAFKPNGTDPRNKLFMPFSLTQRDVQFTLTIVDPRDNGVVYTTQDATKGWDGYDQRTGKMTPGETVYIWKVQLENPLPNERQVYAGTVVHD